mmetsp:Transcript_7593/g.12105  ORF Transcript_7593/g.12105 Transcript_7593/m.12105 type:complete len:188 (-) Transcript_7593:398-961(-)
MMARWRSSSTSEDQTEQVWLWAPSASVSKPHGKAVQEAIQRVLENMPTSTLHDKLRKVGNVVVGSRTIHAQKAALLLLGVPMYNCSREAIHITLPVGDSRVHTLNTTEPHPQDVTQVEDARETGTSERIRLLNGKIMRRRTTQAIPLIHPKIKSTTTDPDNVRTILYLYLIEQVRKYMYRTRPIPQY